MWFYKWIRYIVSIKADLKYPYKGMYLSGIILKIVVDKETQVFQQEF